MPSARIKKCKPDRVSSASPVSDERTIALDLADEGIRDLLEVWLVRAGYTVIDVSTGSTKEGQDERKAAKLLITDNFGPGRERTKTLAALKEQQPDLHIAVVGAKECIEPEQLALARVAGADAALRLPLSRQQIMDLVERFCA